MDTSKAEAKARRTIAWIEILLCLLPVSALWMLGAPFLVDAGGGALHRVIWPEAHVAEFEEEDADDPLAEPVRKPARVLASDIAQTRQRATRKLYLLGLLIGGLAGWPSLWSLVLPTAFGRDAPKRIGHWRGLGLLFGLASCAWFLASTSNDWNLRHAATLIWVYGAAGPMLVALHQLASVAVRRYAARAPGDLAA